MIPPTSCCSTNRRTTSTSPRSRSSRRRCSTSPAPSYWSPTTASCSSGSRPSTSDSTTRAARRSSRPTSSGRSIAPAGTTASTRGTGSRSGARGRSDVEPRVRGPRRRPREPARRGRKLSYKEQREHDGMEEAILEAETEAETARGRDHRSRGRRGPCEGRRRVRSAFRRAGEGPACCTPDGPNSRRSSPAIDPGGGRGGDARTSIRRGPRSSVSSAARNRGMVESPVTRKCRESGTRSDRSAACGDERPVRPLRTTGGGVQASRGKEDRSSSRLRGIAVRGSSMPSNSREIQPRYPCSSSIRPMRG